MSDSDNKLNEAVARLIGELRAAEMGSDRWRSAVEDLAGLGYEAIPFLMEGLKERQLSVYAGLSNVLRKIGPTGIYDVVEELKRGDEHTKAIAAGILKGFLQQEETSVEEAVTALAEALGDDDQFVRHEAAMALAMGGPAAASAIPALMRSLRDEDYAVREWAAHALAAMAPLAKETVPQLTELLLDDVPPVREAASDALDAIRVATS